MKRVWLAVVIAAAVLGGSATLYSSFDGAFSPVFASDRCSGC